MGLLVSLGLFIPGVINPDLLLRTTSCGFYDITIYNVLISVCCFFLPLIIIVVLHVRAIAILRKNQASISRLVSVHNESTNTLATTVSELDVRDLDSVVDSTKRELPNLATNKRTFHKMLAKSHSIESLHDGTENRLERRHTLAASRLSIQSNQSDHSAYIPNNSGRRRSLFSAMSNLQKRASVLSLTSFVSQRRRSVFQVRESKAEKALIVVVICFTLLWFPFFFVSMMTAVTPTNAVDDTVHLFILWLGYCSSGINPCIYTLFNSDFRKAFHKIVCSCHCADKHDT